MGDEAAGAAGARVPPHSLQAHRQGAEADRLLDVGGVHRAAAEGAAPGSLVRAHHLLLRAAAQWPAHFPLDSYSFRCRCAAGGPGGILFSFSSLFYY